MASEIEPLHFIEHIIEEDLKNGMDPKSLRFRFPPEPNGIFTLDTLRLLE